MKSGQEERWTILVCEVCGSVGEHDEWDERHMAPSYYDKHPVEVVPLSRALTAESQVKELEEERDAGELFEVEAVLDDLHPDLRDNPANWVRRALRAREARYEALEGVLRDLIELDGGPGPHQWSAPHVRAAWNQARSLLTHSVPVEKK